MDLNIAKASRIGTDTLIDSLMSGVRTLDPATAFRTLNKRKIADKPLVMRRLLEAPRSDRQVKLEAALALGQSRHRDRVKILLAQLAKDDDLVRFGVLRALGRQDDPDLFDEIRAFRGEVKTGFLKQEARYAETQLAYRLNLSKGTIKAPAKRKIVAPGKDSVPISLRTSKLGDEIVAEIREGFRDQAIGIETSKSPVFSARCGRKDAFVLLSDQFARHRTLNWLLGGKSLPAVMGYKEACPEVCTAAFHLFCHPANKAGRVTLHGLDTRGRIMLVGEGQAEGTTLTFSLKSLDVPGQAALHIEGALDAAKRSLTFKEAVSDLRVHRPRNPKVPRADGQAAR